METSQIIKIALVTVLVLAAIGGLVWNEQKKSEVQAEKARITRIAVMGMMQWRRIDGGTFVMGSANGEAAEKPVHRVTVPSFMLSHSEVTVRQYAKCVEGGVCRKPGDKEQCNWGKEAREDHPVNCLRWGEARAFAQWIGGDLPSEAEWEYAARSRDSELSRPWGKMLPTCERAVMSEGGLGCGKESSWPVCSKNQGHSKQKLCDMIGNVNEWVLDEYHDNYEGAPTDGSAWCENVSCIASRATRVTRGGSWYDDEPQSLNASARVKDPEYGRYFYLGFRVRKSATQ